MKPSWDDAPNWAQWLAMDSDGTWYWSESKPIKASSAWCTLIGKNHWKHAHD